MREERREWSHFLEHCKIFFKEDWMQGGLIPYLDGVEENDEVTGEIDGIQEVERLPDNGLLKNSYFKTTSTKIMVGGDVKDYPHVPTD